VDKEGRRGGGAHNDSTGLMAIAFLDKAVRLRARDRGRMRCPGRTGRPEKPSQPGSTEAIYGSFDFESNANPATVH